MQARTDSTAFRSGYKPSWTDTKQSAACKLVQGLHLSRRYNRCVPPSENNLAPEPSGYKFLAFCTRWIQVPQPVKRIQAQHPILAIRTHVPFQLNVSSLLSKRIQNGSCIRCSPSACDHSFFRITIFVVSNWIPAPHLSKCIKVILLCEQVQALFLSKRVQVPLFLCENKLCVLPSECQVRTLAKLIPALVLSERMQMPSFLEVDAGSALF